MSPSTALTTACSGSPSKLNEASPLLPPRFGGGEAATLRLITWPVPRRICARGPSFSASISVSIAPAPASGGCCWLRESVGGGSEAQAASSVISRAADAFRQKVRKVIGTVYLLVGLARCLAG